MQTTGGLSLGGITITPPPPPSFSTFGGSYISLASSVANWCDMNADGTVFVTGNYLANNVYVYNLIGTSWEVQQTIAGTGSFGLMVSLSADGLTLAVGGMSGGKIYYRANTNTTFSEVFATSATRADVFKLSSDGTVFVYPSGAYTLKLGKNTAGNWSEISTYNMVTLSGNFPVVTMNSDGSRIAYAKVYEQVGGIQTGQVQILNWGRTAGSPALIQTINEPTPLFANNFGNNLYMSPDGSMLVVSSRYNHSTTNPNFRGAVYVYVWNGSQYDLLQSFIGNVGDKLGVSTALGGDVLVMTKAGLSPQQYQVYTRSGDAWSAWSLRQTTELPSGFTSITVTGGTLHPIAISQDGEHFIIAGTDNRFVYNYQGG